MIVYGSSLSPFVRKVLAFAAEKGIELELQPTGFPRAPERRVPRGEPVPENAGVSRRRLHARRIRARSSITSKPSIPSRR